MPYRCALLGLVVVSLATGCPGPPPAVGPSSLQTRTVAGRTMALPAGWVAVEDVDGSIKVDAPEKDVVLNAGALASPVASPIAPDAAEALTKGGLQRLGATDLTALTPAQASPGTVYCAKGSSGVNTVVLCIYDSGTVAAGGPIGMVLLQGTSKGWARTGLQFLSAVLESMSGFEPLG